MNDSPKIVGWYQYQPVYAWREIEAENFSPMLTKSQLWQNFKNNCIQVLIISFSERCWINICKYEFSENIANKGK